MFLDAAHAGHAGDSAGGGEGCTRGSATGGYLGGCYTGTQPEARIDAYLMNY